MNPARTPAPAFVRNARPLQTNAGRGKGRDLAFIWDGPVSEMNAEPAVGAAAAAGGTRLGRALAAAIPGARLVEVPGAGHMLPYEEPDLLAELIGSAAEGGAS